MNIQQKLYRTILSGRCRSDNRRQIWLCPVLPIRLLLPPIRSKYRFCPLIFPWIYEIYRNQRYVLPRRPYPARYVYTFILPDKHKFNHWIIWRLVLSGYTAGYTFWPDRHFINGELIWPRNLQCRGNVFSV